MKVRIDIDCTPEEARRFLGLPDVSELNATAVRELQDKLHAALGRMDPESLLKTWTASGTEGWRQMQEAFWSQMKEAAGGGQSGKGGKDDTS